ncbi:hypothetical protein F4805DRAFT_357072 [Annulohypoxylon moriforme]|nr:hypothetical protein F4805DRAFT_357072 [Annulohypoxylon moriforme]
MWPLRSIRICPACPAKCLLSVLCKVDAKLMPHILKLITLTLSLSRIRIRDGTIDALLSLFFDPCLPQAVLHN